MRRALLDPIPSRMHKAVVKSFEERSKGKETMEAKELYTMTMQSDASVTHEQLQEVCQPLQWMSPALALSPCPQPFSCPRPPEFRLSDMGFLAIRERLGG